MKIYVAGFFDDRMRIRAEAEKLWRMGHEIVSTWLNEALKPKCMSEEDFEFRLALKDLAEVQSSDLIIVDTLNITPRGGRDVEYGFALGRHQHQLSYIVGPKRNLFHLLATKHFEDWGACLDYMKENHAVH